MDVSREYLGPCTDILARARTADNRLTALKVVNCLSGKGEAALRPPGYEHRGRSRLEVELALAAMLLEGHVKEEFSFTPYKTNSYIVEGPRKGSSSGLVIKVPKSEESKKRKGEKTVKAAEKKVKKKAKSEPEVVEVESDGEEDFVT